MRDIFAIIQDLKDEDWQVRRAAVQELQQAGDVRALELFVLWLRDRHPRVRQAAAEALAEQGDLDAAEALLDALTDKDDYVRLYAVSALGRLRYAGAAPRLIKRLRDPYHYVREKAAWALGELAGTSFDKNQFLLVEKALLYMLEKDWLLDNRRAAARALGKLGAEEKLLELAHGEDPDKAAYAMEELRRQAGVSGREPSRGGTADLAPLLPEVAADEPELSGREPAAGRELDPGQSGREPAL